MKDVARIARVSTATVSRVLNGQGVVSVDTAARVMRTISELGYKPNVFAQGLMTRKSRLLGLVLPDIHGEFYSELIRGADAQARELGFVLVISSEAPASETPLLASGTVGFLGGLAMMLAEPNDALWAQARNAGLPLVVIDEDLAGEHIDRVLMDNRSGTLEAVQHLLSTTPAARCFFIGGPKNNFDTEERTNAFVGGLARRGSTNAADRVMFGDYTVEGGRTAAMNILTANGRAAVGILAGNDDIAFGVMQAATELGLEVPKQVRIIGFDDSRLASLVRPQLSSVHVPMGEVGAAAVRLLVRRLHDPQRPAEIVRLSTRLVTRASSQPTA